MVTAYRRGPHQEVQALSVDDLLTEFVNKAAATSEDATVWELADHVVTPPFLTALFGKIDASDCELKGVHGIKGPSLILGKSDFARGFCREPCDRLGRQSP